MRAQIEAYLNQIEQLFIHSPIVKDYKVRSKDVREQEGYLRIRATLTNNDVLETFEFVALIGGSLSILTYRLHWQTVDGQLKYRWDNAEHHQEIPTFPHHVHVQADDVVQPSEPMSIQKVLEWIERE